MPLWTAGLPFNSSNRGEATVERLNEGARKANELRQSYWPRQTFRGLHLGVSRSGSPLSAVTLFKADEIVMHDGYIATDFQNLSAAITTSGAGGLDTGSEANSAWYEIYAIQRSFDDAKALMLHRGPSFVLSGPSSVTDISASSSIQAQTTKLAQGFVALSTAPVSYVDLYIARTGTPAGFMYVTIESSSGGNPSGVVLGTSDSYSPFDVNATSGWHRFYFRSPFTLSLGTSYHIVLQLPGATVDASNYIGWARSVTSYYPDGVVATWAPSSWTQNASSDFAFQLKHMVPSTAVTLPTGYDRYARVGWVYNSSLGNFLKFYQTEKNVYTPEFNVATFSIGGLVDLSAYVPPIPVMFKTGMAHTVANTAVWMCPSDSYPQSIATGLHIMYPHIANAGSPDPGPDILCEGQAIYTGTSAPSATLYARGYQW